MLKSAPVVKNLLFINLVIFSLQIIFKYIGISLVYSFALFPVHTEYFHLHQLITHQFLHAGLFHIIFNMFALATIGPYVEKELGSNKFLAFYLISGIGASLLHLYAISTKQPMVGASGALYGILVLFTMFKPNEKLFLFFIPIGIKAKYLIPVLIGVEIYLGLFSQSDGIGHWAHIGGAITGSLLYLYNKHLTTQ